MVKSVNYFRLFSILQLIIEVSVEKVYVIYSKVIESFLLLLLRAEFYEKIFYITMTCQLKIKFISWKIMDSNFLKFSDFKYRRNISVHIIQNNNYGNKCIFEINTKINVFLIDLFCFTLISI